MKPIFNLTGQKFGRWTVISEAPRHGQTRYWLCQCDCGTVREVRQQNLINGQSTSCGCYHREEAKSIGNRSRKHGDFGTHLYGIWAGMKRRCYNPHTKYYEDYGGRGIKVCDKWLDYVPFKEWATSHGYSEGMSIERLDVNGNYCPENCTWIPKNQQNRNKRNTIRIEYKGKTYTLKEISEITHIKEHTLFARYQRGWTSEEIFNPKLKQNQFS